MSFILGALFSPGTDIMSMLLFSGLLMGLYIVSILAAQFFYPKDRKEG
jgi:Sec-independent protein secretion pathway component TatC